MSDHLTRGFRAQLTSTLDSVLRKAVFEVMTIFENTLHDHQMELAQKGEEVAQLKIKLQTAELRLKDIEFGGDKGAERRSTRMNQRQKAPQAVMDTSGQTPDVPEIHFEVPDDWCAPLGYEPIKPDEVVCPSVRLRPLSIPLCHVPVLKNEVINLDVYQQKTRHSRRSRRIFDFIQQQKRTQDRKLPGRDQQIPRRPLKNDLKHLLQNIKQEYCDLTTDFEGLRRSRRNLPGKDQENITKSKQEQRQSAAKKDGKNAHTKRSQMGCRGCKKVFPLKKSLRSHKQLCRKLKKMLAKEATKPSENSCEEKTPTSNKKQVVVVKKRSAPSLQNHSKLSTQEDESTKTYCCTHCSKKFDYPYKLKQHLLIHTGERPFCCKICTKKFRIKQSLKIHEMRVHKGQKNFIAPSQDVAWTEPLEDIEDSTEDTVSSSKDKRQEIISSKVHKEGSSPSWKTMGRRYRGGFACSLCGKVLKNKTMLIEHHQVHTAEKPMKCQRCAAQFHTKMELHLHSKNCRFSIITIQCKKLSI